MDDVVGVKSGIVVLQNPPESTIDIVAVHGLGANPDWAWIRKVKRGTEELKINWLADDNLLPAAIPSARIMTFNYESRWHRDAPAQRRSLCANQFLTALDNNRKEQSLGNVIRPIIFIGHSFGGIVIEEAIIQATTNGSPFHYLATSTAGIIFLGTPHRGTEASKWGELIAVSGSYLGFDTKDSILRDLRKDSETLSDLLYQFSLWLFRCSVPAVCFFEQYKTNYGKRYGISWNEMVVDERSACIDGHRKVPLPTDHFKINKFEGPQDSCYTTVAPIIAGMAQGALEAVQTRIQPRLIVQDDSLVPPHNLGCFQSLFLTNPVDDLANIRGNKDSRVEGTCEWLLVHEQYTAWSVGRDSQVLRLIGGPGIGKTMISSFLVDELEDKAKRTPGMTLAYYFCDNKEEKRNSASAILRGLLLQILGQLPILFKHIQSDYNQQQKELFSNLDALWRILQNMLEDRSAGEVYLLIDALDECEKSSRKRFLTVLTNLLHSPRLAKMRLKILITSRPESDIESSLSGVEQQLHVDSGKVNADLSKFIDVKVEEISRNQRYPAALSKKVRSALTEHAGGTFLWASLVLKDLSETKALRLVSKKLQSLPSGIYEVYDSILSQIETDYRDIVKIIFRWVVLARRPLTMDELAMVLALSTDDYDEDTIPPEEDLDLFKEDFRCCGSLIYLDTGNNTINLVHQSAKDYFLENHLNENTILSGYRIEEDNTHLFIFETCWRYLTVAEFEHGHKIIKRNGNMLAETHVPHEYLYTHIFLQYAAEEWQEHAIAAYRTFLNNYNWDHLHLGDASTLRDSWLIRAAESGQETIVRKLLEEWAADPNSRGDSGQTPLWWAVQGGHVEVVQVLLNTAGVDPNSRDESGKTPLLWAIQRGHVEVVQILLNTAGVDPDSKDILGRTPLWQAAQTGYVEVVQILLNTAGVDPNSRDIIGQTALSWAAQRGYFEAVQILLNTAGVDPNSRDPIDQTPLSLAAKEGYVKVVQILLNTAGVDPDSKEIFGQTPLSLAAKEGYVEVVQILLNTAGVDPDSKDILGRTPLWQAAQGGYVEVVQILLNTAGVDPNSRDAIGQTPLLLAAKSGQIKVVQILLNTAGIDPALKDVGGCTPLLWATERGHFEVVQILQARLEQDNRNS